MNQKDAERVVEEVIAAEKEEAQIQLADNSDLVQTLKSMLDKKITQMDAKLETFIESLTKKWKQ